MALFAPDVFLRGAPGDQLHAPRYHIRACVFHQKNARGWR